MSLVYWLSKFSHEALLVELLLIGCVAACYFLYLLVQKRRYGVAKKNIPDHVVRAFLVELISYSEGFKNQLFGEDFKIQAAIRPAMSAHAVEPMLAAAATHAPVATADGADLTAAKTALAAATLKQDELQKMIATLSKDKAALESKLAAAPATGDGAASGQALTEANEKISKLESKLAEYEVIEDDLANLKKYQQENKALRAQLEAGKKGEAIPSAPASDLAAASAEVVPAAPAATTAAPISEPATEPSPVAAAEESAAATKAEESFEGLAGKVEESLATHPSGASAADPLASAAAEQPPAAEATPEAAASTATTPPPVAKEKSDADLLNEFERMLSS